MDIERRLKALERKIDNIVRVGRVSSVGSGTVRVIIEGESKIVTGNLPVMHARAGNHADYAMPEPGEQVVCVFLPIGNERGFVLGATYSQSDPVPTSDASQRVIAGDELRLAVFDAAQSIVRGDAFRALFNTHTHMTGVGLSGPPQEDALLVPMDNPVSTTGPHTTNRVRVP